MFLLGAVHRCEANFHITCGIDGCVRTYHNYYSFRKHLLRSHPGDTSASGDSTDASNMGTSASGDNTDSIVDHMLIDESENYLATTEPELDSFRTSALFLIKAQEIHKVSQTALDDIIAELTFICSRELTVLQSKVFKCLSIGGVDPYKINGLKEIFNKCYLHNPFHGLTSDHLRGRYIEEHLGFVVCYLLLLFQCISPCVDCNF